jgi:hypothetical protein
MLKDWITRKLTHSAGIRDTARDDTYPPSSKLARTGLIQSRYLLLLALGVAMWTGVSLASILIVDPYGVSPVHVAIAGVNVLKPKRVDVDRLIKPYEVSRHQPRTVFLGTSRTQQSIDPAVLDGTRFAPAYNAAMPASSLRMSLSDLQQYVALDRNLRTAFVEVFISEFLGLAPDERAPTTDLIANDVAMFGSSDALWASIATLMQNAVIKKETFEIKPGGYLYRPPGGEAKGNFDAFAHYIWRHQPKFELSEAAFNTVRELVAAARAKNIELTFLATPNHAYFDYYIDTIGGWDVVEEWLRRLSKEATVYSFSQPNDWVYEPVRRTMRYWNDPLHFSLSMGRGISGSLGGLSVPDLPDNFMVRLTPDNVAAHIKSRREAIGRWAQDNPSYVDELDREHRKLQSTNSGVQ